MSRSSFLTRRRRLSVGITLVVVALAGCGSDTGTTGADESSIVVQTEDVGYTMINVLTPGDGTQDEVVEALQEGLGNQVATFPGFIGAAIHRSLDDDTVIVYAHWDSQDAVDAAVTAIGEGEAPSMAQAFTIAEPDFHPYDVVSVIPASAD